MKIRTTTRFVDREALAANPHDPDAADTSAGTVLIVSAERALYLVDTGFADPIGIDRATLAALALAECEAALLASVTAIAPAPPAPAADTVDEQRAEAAAPTAAAEQAAQPAEADTADTAGTADPSDGGPVDLNK